MTKKKPRRKRRIVVAGGVAAAGTGTAAAARARRRRADELASRSRAAAREPQKHGLADRARSWLHAAREKVRALAHRLRHPSGAKPA